MFFRVAWQTLRQLCGDKTRVDTVLVLFRLLKAFLKIQLVPNCDQCGSHSPPLVTLVTPDCHFITPWLGGRKRAPPNQSAPPNSQAIAM